MSEMTQGPRETTYPNPRESVLDRFAQRYIFEKGADGATHYDRFLKEHPDLSPETKDLLDFVIKKTANARLGVLKSVDYKSYEHAFQVLFSELYEKPEFSEVLDVLSRIYYVILRETKGKEGNQEIQTVIERYGQDEIPLNDIAAAMIRLTPEVLCSIENDMSGYMLLLGHRKYIIKIGKQFDGAAKLQKLLDEASKLQAFNGYHLSQIVVGADWEQKLNYFKVPENVKALNELGFNGYHLSQIVTNAGWQEKLVYILSKEEEVKTVIRDNKISTLLDFMQRKSWRKDVEAFLSK